jgi:hypothetical protein
MLFQISRSDLWYADIVNFMVAGYVPLGGDKRKLIYESHLHIWDDMYLFRVCLDGLHRRCVPAEEGIKIIERCHSSPYGGPFTVISTSSHGAVTLQNDEGTLFKVNGQRLKIFLEPDKS